MVKDCFTGRNSSVLVIFSAWEKGIITTLNTQVRVLFGRILFFARTAPQFEYRILSKEFEL